MAVYCYFVGCCGDAAPPPLPTMQKASSFPVPGGTARLVSKDDLRESAPWRGAFAAQCKDYRYYEILEGTLEDGFEHHYLVLEDNAGNVRAVQPLFFVQQNLTEGVTGKVRAAVDFVRRRFPRFLTMRVMMIGCAAGEGHLGACSGADEAWVAQALHASTQNL